MKKPIPLRSWAEVENQFDLTGAICRKPEFAETPNLWETVTGKIKLNDRIARWEQAAALCKQCPAIKACKARREYYASIGFRIDGVVAGEIPPYQQKFCRGCGAEFWFGKVLPPGMVRFWRTGYCRKCYETRRKTAHK